MSDFGFSKSELNTKDRKTADGRPMTDAGRHQTGEEFGNSEMSLVNVK
jgi:hypothetical protein